MTIADVASVLRVIGDRGVLVGSARDGSLFHKDVDVVIKDRQVFRDLLREFTVLCDSEIPGHLVVRVEPTVEVFEEDTALCASKQLVTRAYSTLRRQSTKREIFGVVFRVWNG